MEFIMFKILNLILVSALILIVSIACSSAPPEEYVTQVEYNKLLTHTSELETRLSTLQLIVLTDLFQLDVVHSPRYLQTIVAKQCVGIASRYQAWDTEECMVKIQQHLSKDIK